MVDKAKVATYVALVNGEIPVERKQAVERFKQICDEYGWIVKGEAEKKPLPDDCKTAIGDLINMIVYYDKQTSNIVTLADAAVAEAQELTRAVLSTEEGQELIAWLQVTKPNSFP
jgi:hypothetical protein